MKQIAQYQDGRLELQDVPAPTAPPGGILVRLTHSIISVGTERMKLEQARMNLLQKARARPDQVRKVLDTARTLGWRSALEKVRNRLEIPSPLGYSAAGVVVAVDAANTRFRVGDRVAIGGAECAFHAELAAVPDMLAAAVPEGVPNEHAAYTTIASIALQAVRQLAPALGDRVLVVGQGLVGLLVTAMLRASGARVLALDVAEPRRRLAAAMGAERIVISGAQDLKEEVRAWTDGFGVDAAVLAASSGSNAPTEQALEALRDRGRMVVVGKTRVDLPWEVAYHKEIELRYSRSYGPGRYDPVYEWGGTDYPAGYVRWTEQRNFEACLELMRSGALDLDALTTRRAKFSDALAAYGRLIGEGAAHEAGIVLEYEATSTGRSGPPQLVVLRPDVQDTAPPPVHSPPQPPALTPQPSALTLQHPVGRLDVIGAGNFARSMLLPHLAGRMALGTVVNNTALSAQHVARKFGFAASSTRDEDALAGPGPAAVLIATRHHLHAPGVIAALRADRHVYVEKPLCLTRAELTEIESALAASHGSLMVGFNRRFAPAAVHLKETLRAVPGPRSVSYRVMAGALDPSSWYANYAESGGRVLGEACHFADFLCWLLEATPVRVSGQTLRPARGRLAFADSFAAQFEFADGSCAQLIYSADGDPGWPKETCTVFAAGLSAELQNYRQLVVHRRRRRERQRAAGKGHAEEMRAWAAFLRGQAPHPMSFASIRRGMQASFALLECLQGRDSRDAAA